MYLSRSAAAVVIQSAETFVEAQIVADRILPGEADCLLLEVREKPPDVNVNIIEADGAGGVRHDGHHD